MFPLLTGKKSGYQGKVPMLKARTFPHTRGQKAIAIAQALKSKDCRKGNALPLNNKCYKSLFDNIRWFNSSITKCHIR